MDSDIAIPTLLKTLSTTCESAVLEQSDDGDNVFWLRRTDSNCRPDPYRGFALPLSYTASEKATRLLNKRAGCQCQRTLTLHKKTRMAGFANRVFHTSCSKVRLARSRPDRPNYAFMRSPKSISVPFDGFIDGQRTKLLGNAQAYCSRPRFWAVPSMVLWHCSLNNT